MNNDDTKKLRELIDDMRARASSMNEDAYKLMEKAKIIESESYKIENEFVHLLFPDE